MHVIGCSRPSVFIVCQQLNIQYKHIYTLLILQKPLRSFLSSTSSYHHRSYNLLNGNLGWFCRSFYAMNCESIKLTCDYILHPILLEHEKGVYTRSRIKGFWFAKRTWQIEEHLDSWIREHPSIAQSLVAPSDIGDKKKDLVVLVQETEWGMDFFIVWNCLLLKKKSKEMSINYNLLMRGYFGNPSVRNVDLK